MSFSWIKKIFKKSPTKVLVLVGPTSSGKSELAIEVAKKFCGEVISADSRQIYLGLENFSGVVAKKEMSGIPHHLISFIKPGCRYTAKDFEIDALREIDSISGRGKLPIVAGGSSFWIDGLLYKRSYAEVPENSALRETLEKKTNSELLELIKEKEPGFTKKIDADNRRRLVRAVEIINALGYVPKMSKKMRENYNFFLVYLDPAKPKLKQKIERRFLLRRDAIMKEAERLRPNLSCSEFRELGLSFKHICDYWDGKINIDEFTEVGIVEESRYPKKQRTYINKMYDRYMGNKARVTIDETSEHVSQLINKVKHFLSG